MQMLLKKMLVVLNRIVENGRVVVLASDFKLPAENMHVYRESRFKLQSKVLYRRNKT